MARKSEPIEELFAVEQNRTSTTELIIQKIKRLLIERKLKPGDPLPSENQLTLTMGVSRGSIREAMKVLSAFGVVEIRRGDGTYIATSANPRIFDPLVLSLLVHNTDPEELIQLRALIELDVARTVIRNATDAQVAELRTVHERLALAIAEGTSSDDELNGMDVAFHRTMARIAGNHLLENIYNFIIDLFAPTINARSGAHTHRRIVEAIERRDESLAEESEREHIEAWRRSYHTP